MLIRTVHPFPARMAPELALASLADLPADSVVLDPMSGSGTVLRQALALGHRAVGFDMDPLAVLMSRVWTTPISEQVLDSELKQLLCDAAQVDLRSQQLHWHDQETREFVGYWFDAPQRRSLARLAYVLDQRRRARLSPPRRAAVDALSIALSRLIVTKEQGASLARDTSHSRPHKVALTSSYDVESSFVRSVRQLSQRLADQPSPRPADVKLGDARNLELAPRSVDAVLTSPPYLNAIDYMRGHRLALVWLGYTLAELRTIRSTTIGAERAADQDGGSSVRSVAEAMGRLEQLQPRQRRMVERYAGDLLRMLSQVERVLSGHGHATFVVGNSCLKDTFIRNSDGVAQAARQSGLVLVSTRERELPPGSRYLPMPTRGALSKRMRTETVMTFRVDHA
ncbi:DNA modification methyltransferase [Luteimonas padinae]|uniref:site-specific DNA-methyltransferase (cytosine-N(4)-specific) n=1 Tax=Luteimonas padinae TaxID=1714359 RepID=A0ABV6SWH6_9GAMM|nr:site-specific DNA-methyltransferase [Luteimonas padinae]GHD68908.1 DNA modification methyltransferase [Luteimonas padinae]